MTAVVAIYSPERGVGRTTLAINLAWCAAQAGHRTLLWDLDPNGGATRLLSRHSGGAPVPPAPFPTQTDGLDLLAAPAEGWHLQLLSTSYERIVLDCAPELDASITRLFRSAAAILVPMNVSADAQALLDDVVGRLDAAKARKAPLLPVFTKADRRRASHREAIASLTEWPMIPYAGAVGATSGTGAALGKIAPRSPAARAFASLWSGVDRRLERRP
ncbi:MAG: ParA family protein [Sphingomonadaceae bacterium]|nr:ParA family protein [Sphingomonadaceae bacterium]